ncbi:phosphatidylinositol transfer protein SFH5, partial [Trichodelitschia bisporula]
GPVWPTLDADHPLSLLVKELPSILEKADYAEVYGVQLKADTPFHTKLILQKFLRANSNVVPKAKEQLLATLKWRKEYQPLKALEETFSEELFGGLGFVTLVEKVPGSTKDKEVVTYNVYGAVKDIQKTFGNVDTFLRWRVALMELGISKLSLATATEPIPDFGKGADQYQGIQVHDYKSISFLRQDPHIKAASKQTIDLFSKYYPETLSKKFFLNVPLVMSWLFTFFKALLPSATTKKFSVISYGTSLTSELGPDIPKEYGGKAGALDSVSETVKL